jgi:hypothetical protein
MAKSGRPLRSRIPEGGMDGTEPSNRYPTSNGVGACTGPQRPSRHDEGGRSLFRGVAKSVATTQREPNLPGQFSQLTPFASKGRVMLRL